MKKTTLTLALATALFTSMTLLNCSKKEDPAPAPATGSTTSGTTTRSTPTTTGTTTSGTTTTGTTTSGSTTSGSTTAGTTTAGTTTAGTTTSGTGTGTFNDGSGVKNGISIASRSVNTYTVVIYPASGDPVISVMIYTNGSSGTFDTYDFSNPNLGSVGSATYSSSIIYTTLYGGTSRVIVTTLTSGKLVGTYNFIAPLADKTASKTVTGSFDVTFK